jgi:hypothetical protein
MNRLITFIGCLLASFSFAAAENMEEDIGSRNVCNGKTITWVSICQSTSPKRLGRPSAKR